VNRGELNFERTTMILAGAIVGMFFFVCGALGYFIFLADEAEREFQVD
jgi:hypothetical protein